MTTADPRIQALFREYPGHPYKKWQGAHWRLLSLVELGVTQDDDRARRHGWRAAIASAHRKTESWPHA